MKAKNFLKHKDITDRQIPIWSEKKYILLSELLEEFASIEPKYKSFGNWIIECDDVKAVDRVFYQYKGNLLTGAQLKEKYNQLKELNKL